MSALIFWGWYKNKVRLTLWSLSLLYYFLCAPFFSSGLLAWLEAPSKDGLTHTNPQTVVVLGGGIKEGDLHLPLSSDALKRALVGVSYAKTNNLPLFFSGGGNKALSEAEGFLISINSIYKPFNVNVAKEINFITEDKSLNTVENAKFLASLLASNKTITLVTSAYHMKRSRYIFEHFGFNVIELPADFKQDYPSTLIWQDFLPSLHGLHQSYIVSHEIFGILSLWPQGIWSPF
ncbi:MAG: YdcF family protein [Campylobacteraceae bacterium]|nr:YdcF family protein [Campylobacteraceae bacterium]